MNGAASTPGEATEVFTQCANCHTVFQLSAEVLRAAGGQVRCGRCGEIFSALARLAEDANSFDTGESAYEMEERADSILESVVAEQVAHAVPDDSDEDDFDGAEIARLQVLDFTDDDLIDEAPEEATDEAPEGGRDAFADAAMEFTLPPTELDRIFVDSNVSTAPPPVAEPPMAVSPPAPSLAEDDGPLPDIEVISDDRTYDLQSTPQRAAGSFTLWWCAAIVAALLLLGQVVNRNREALSAHGPWAAGLRLLYASIGVPLDDTPNLAVYQLRQWGVTGAPEAGQPAANATLRLRASILNTSAQPQPFPLLRVTLENRYGTALGARDFEPYEYLGKLIDRSLVPGESVDAILDILDPGKEAEGFEIDVCLRHTDKKIVCANDAAAAQARQ